MPLASALPAHDLEHGHIDACQICGAPNLELVLDLGHQPPCNSLLNGTQMNEAETSYPLRFVRCTDCGHAQIDYVVAPSVLFHPDYPYRSGITPTLARNLQSTARAIVDSYAIEEGALAIDIGSNDGTLLKGFQAKGLRVVGVEATNIANIAIADGIDTFQAFFSREIANEIVKAHGQAAVITATNMFAHVANLGEFLRGIEILLRKGGVFVTESHYLLDLLETLQYDSIYHEHLKFYSIAALIRLLSYYDFTVVDAQRIPNYAGSIRVFAVKGKQAKTAPRLQTLLDAETAAALHTAAPFSLFRQKVREAKLELLRLLTELTATKSRVPGIGCPGRASTLINYCNIDADLVPYIAEQNSSLKLGLYLPGRHIPIVDEARLFEEQPDHCLMLSWHYADPIIASLATAWTALQNNRAAAFRARR